MRLSLPHLTSTIEMICEEHPLLTVQNLIRLNQDYKKLLKNVKETEPSELLSFSCKLPIHKLNFLALAILDDDSELRSKILYILTKRKRSSYLALLFPFLQNDYKNSELQKLIRFYISNGYQLPLSDKGRKLFQQILNSNSQNLPHFTANYLIEKNMELDFFIELSEFKPASLYIEKMVEHLIDKAIPERISGDELILYLPVLKKIDSNRFLSFIKKYTKLVGLHSFLPELADLTVEKLGDPRDYKNKNWHSTNKYMREIISMVHTRSLLKKLTTLDHKFELYTKFKDEIHGIKYIENSKLAFIIFENIVVFEMISSNVEGMILSKENFEELMNKEKLPNGKMALAFLPPHNSNFEESEYLLKTYLKKRGLIQKIVIFFSKILWNLRKD
jgi:hypothetical protein